MKKGFVIVGKELTHPGEIIINRGTDRKSNFFIFINLRKKRFCYWHPGKGLEFKPYRSLVELRERLEAVEDERIKSSNSYFVHLHGHWKSKHDDGASSMKTVIRDLMLHHVDFDLSGYHNGIIEDEMWEISRLEALANITKGISTEVSLPLPLKGKRLRNGPHMKLWIRDVETAREIEEKFLSNRKSNEIYRAFSSDFDVDEFLSWIEAKRDSLSIGTPHPFYGFKFMGKLKATGILHFMERWGGIVDFLLKVSDGVAALNSDCKGSIVVPSNSYVERLLRRLTGSSLVKEEVADMRFAEEHSQEYNSFIYFEPDSHINPDVNYERDVSLLGDGVNEMVSEVRPTYEEVFEALRMRTVRTRLFLHKVPAIVKATMNMQVVALHVALIAKQLL